MSRIILLKYLPSFVISSLNCNIISSLWPIFGAFAFLRGFKSFWTLPFFVQWVPITSWSFVLFKYCDWFIFEKMFITLQSFCLYTKVVLLVIFSKHVKSALFSYTSGSKNAMWFCQTFQSNLIEQCLLFKYWGTFKFVLQVQVPVISASPIWGKWGSYLRQVKLR